MGESIILGMGNNIDYEIVWDSKIFEFLIQDYQINDNELDVNISIHTQRDLVVSILAFLKTEQGGERFVQFSDIIEKFSKNFKKNVTLGGTSVRAAIAMQKLDKMSALHLVTINDDVRRLLPKDCSYVCSAKIEDSFPHLIIQFNKDTCIDARDIKIRTKRANRIIYDNDYDNITMEINQDLSKHLSDAKVFLISGFNAMQDEKLLLCRMDSILKILDHLPKTAKVFYEDACFHKSNFTKIVFDKLIEKIDIYSLNEDELQEYIGYKLDLLNADQVSEALKKIQEIIPVSILIVHTRYWAIAYGKDAKNMSKYLKGGISMATTRFQFGDAFTKEDYYHTENLAPECEGVEFAKDISSLLGDTVCCQPSLMVDVKKATTIGLGDAFVGGFLAEFES